MFIRINYLFSTSCLSILSFTAKAPPASAAKNPADVNTLVSIIYQIYPCLCAFRLHGQFETYMKWFVFLQNHNEAERLVRNAIFIESIVS